VDGRINQKLEPRPGIESAPMVPPSISTNFLQRARPSPLPCAWRLVELSTWLNSWNSFSLSSRGDADPGIHYRNPDHVLSDHAALIPSSIGRAHSCRLALRRLAVSATAPTIASRKSVFARVSNIRPASILERSSTLLIAQVSDVRSEEPPPGNRAAVR
jgi:hypothetical protein